MAYAYSVLAPVAVLLVKLLLLTMLIRIFCSVRLIVRYFIQAFAVFLVAYYVTMFVLRICCCIPPSAFWNDPIGKCLNFYAILIVDYSTSLITDLVICTLPIFLVSTLHLPLKKKIKVAALLGAGGLTIPLNIYRLWLLLSFGSSIWIDWTSTSIHWTYLVYINAHPLNNLVLILLIKYRVVEMSIGLLCACLPTINGLVTFKLHRHRDRLQVQMPTAGVRAQDSISQLARPYSTST